MGLQACSAAERICLSELGLRRVLSRAAEETDYPASSDATKVHTVLVESSLAGRDELVNVIDGSGSSKSEDQALSDAPAPLASDMGGTLGPITYAATGKVIGREFLLNRQGRPPARVRVFVANKHLYEIIAQSPPGPDDAETADFLALFRLLDALMPAPSTMS